MSGGTHLQTDMVEITVRDDVEVDLDQPVLIEGLPGVGLVGKIAADHVVDTLDMTYYAGVSAEGLPQVGVYEEGSREVRPPVRLYADGERDLVVLQSDVPVSRTASAGFAAGLTDWVVEREALPLYISGLPVEDYDPTEVPELYGVASGDAGERLDEHDVAPPAGAGVMGGPAGALLNRAADRGLDAVGLVVESDPQFPDPVAARRVITRGVNPVAGLGVDTEELVEQSEQIREQKESLARQMQEAGEERSSQAQPRGMFQ
jgi:uncharacterized protein